MKIFVGIVALVALLGAASAGFIRSGWSSPYAYSSPVVYSRPAVVYSRPHYGHGYGHGYSGYGGWSSGWRSGWW